MQSFPIGFEKSEMSYTYVPALLMVCYKKVFGSPLCSMYFRQLRAWFRHLIYTSNLISKMSNYLVSLKQESFTLDALVKMA